MPKTVQLSEEAYATLAALKRPGDSFSDTVLRLAASRKNPRAIEKLGPRLDIDYDKMRKEFAKADLARLRELGLVKNGK